MISAEEFVNVLEERDLIPGELVRSLRRQIAASPKPPSAAWVAKRLVDEGHLSRLLAQRLLAQRLLAKGEEEKGAEAAAPPPAAEAPPAEEPAQGSQLASDDELELAPLDDEKKWPKKEAKKVEAKPQPAAKKPQAPAPAGKRPADKAAPAGRAPKPAAAPQAPKAKGPPASEPGKPAQKPQDQAQPPTSAAPLSSLLEEELQPLGGPSLGAMGPLDNLLTDAAAGAAAGTPLAAPRKKTSWFARTGKARTKPKNVWESPLLLLGGGGLLLLVLAGLALLWLVMRQSGDQMLGQADADYHAGSYTQAIHKYELYLAAFPDHRGVGLARVRQGLARIRQASEGSADWSKALTVTKDVLRQIAALPDFKTEGEPEMVALLPKIAQGLAQQARRKSDPQFVQQAEEALALLRRHVAADKLPATKLTDVEDLLKATQEEIASGEELVKAVAAIGKAVAAGKTAEGYEIRRRLLKRYPRLVANDKLRAAILAVSQAELPSVRWAAEARPPETAQPPGPPAPGVALGRRNVQGTVPDAEGQVLFVLAEGSVYGLRGSTGEMLWRRPVGFDSSLLSPGFAPTPVADTPGSDVLLVDRTRNEVVRVEAATGKTRWRHALGEAFDASPVVADRRVMVATRSGRLVMIDLESGASTGYVQLPQALRVAPTFDPRRSNLYQVAEHSNLYVLSAADGKGKQVVYLGHEPGSVTAPPVLIDRYLVVAENDRVESSRLRVLNVESAGEGPPVQVVQEVRIDGHVDTPPLVWGARLLVLADQGDVRVFEMRATDPSQPLGDVAQGKAAGEKTLQDKDRVEKLFRYPLLQGGQVWIADSQLTKYDVQAAAARLQPKWIADERTAALQPPVVVGQAVAHVHRKLGLPGVVVAALGTEDGKPIWETHLAAPLAAEPLVDAASGRVTAVTSTGAIFRSDVAGLQAATVLDQPAAALKPPEVRQPLQGIVPLEGGLVALATGGGQQIQVFDPQVQNLPFRALALPAPLGGPPVVFRGGLLVPSRVGQVFLLDPRSGAKLAEPFQPRLEGVGEIAWRAPAVTGAQEFVLADDQGGLYCVGFREQPKPSLAALATQRLTQPVVGSLAVLGKLVFAADEGNTLMAYELPDLKPGKPMSLDGRCVWGPYQAGDRVLVATDADQLYCLDAQQALAWKVALAHGRLAGPPLAVEGGFLLAASGGTVQRIDGTDGKELGKIDAGWPLATGPVLLGDQLLLSGHDGTLMLLPKP